MGKAHIGKGPFDVGNAQFHPGYEHFAGTTHIIVGRLSFHVGKSYIGEGLFHVGKAQLTREIVTLLEKQFLWERCPFVWEKTHLHLGSGNLHVGKGALSCGE